MDRPRQHGDRGFRARQPLLDLVEIAHVHSQCSVVRFATSTVAGRVGNVQPTDALTPIEAGRVE